MANMAVFHGILHLMPHMSRFWRSLDIRYNMLLNENYVPDNRIKFCLQQIETYLSLGLSKVYLDSHFGEDVQNEVNNDTFDKAHVSMITIISTQVMIMYSLLENETMSAIDRIPWMDEETKVRAKHKLNKMQTFIGTPAQNVTDEWIDQHYKGVSIASQCVQ